MGRRIASAETLSPSGINGGVIMARRHTRNDRRRVSTSDKPAEIKFVVL